jgi:hypothetical protein
MGRADVLSDGLKTLFAIWPDVLLGAGLTLVATWVGWRLGRRRSFPPVKAIAWWVVGVVLPLLRCASWSRRTVLIFLNNGTILAVIVAVGGHRHGGIVGATTLGVGLGIALRVMADASPGLGDRVGASDGPDSRWRMRIGLALNMLEPPAIVVAVGLSMARGSLKVTTEQAWWTFAVFVLPALLFAAGGEALWLGVTNHAPEVCDVEDREPSSGTV